MSEFRTLVVAEDDNTVLINEDTFDVLVTESSPTVVVDLSLVGPPGPAGPQGPPGDAATALAFTHVQNIPTTLVQITHALPFTPAGILCVDFHGDWAEPDMVTYPAPGVLEVQFGSPFSGNIRVS